jgi:hypothetical protein
VVHEPVDHGGGDDLVAEDLAPAIWGCHLFACADCTRYQCEYASGVSRWC